MATYQEGFSSSVATGEQSVTLSLGKGTMRKVTAVYCYIPGADDSANITVHRTDSTAAAANKIGGTKYNAYTSIDSIQDTWATTALKLLVNTGLGSTVTCYFTVVYDYY